jgi:hypothetical protein
MRGLKLEADTSYTDFATELDIDPSYLRRVLKRLKIEGHRDPTHRSSIFRSKCRLSGGGPL